MTIFKVLLLLESSRLLGCYFNGQLLLPLQRQRQMKIRSKSTCFNDDFIDDLIADNVEQALCGAAAGDDGDPSSSDGTSGGVLAA